MYRFCIGKVPFLFDSFFIKNSELYNYNTRSADDLHVPIVKSGLGENWHKIQRSESLCGMKF